MAAHSIHSCLFQRAALQADTCTCQLAIQPANGLPICDLPHMLTARGVVALAGAGQRAGAGNGAGAVCHRGRGDDAGGRRRRLRRHCQRPAPQCLSRPAGAGAEPAADCHRPPCCTRPRQVCNPLVLCCMHPPTLSPAEWHGLPSAQHLLCIRTAAHLMMAGAQQQVQFLQAKRQAAVTPSCQLPHHDMRCGGHAM